MTTNSLQFNYLAVINNDGQHFVARVFEEPTYAKVELDPSQEYITAFIPEGMKKSDYPGIFDNCDEVDDYPTPFRKVMCPIGVCDFCQRKLGFELIHQEYTDHNNHMGYFYCNDCKEQFYECLKRSGTRAIWHLRERNDEGYNIWVPRTRRDANGKRIYTGKFSYEKWRIYGWYAYTLEDKEDGVMKPHIICENESLSKKIPVENIFKLNPEHDLNYNPNEDPELQKTVE
jgi:hypothetical protein